MSDRESTKVTVTFLKAVITLISIESFFTSSFIFNDACSFDSFFAFENTRQHLWSSLKPQEGVFTEVLLFFYFCNGVMKAPAWVITVKNFQWTGLMFSRSISLHFNRQQKLMNIPREWILKGHFQWTIHIWNVLETSNYIKMINLLKVTLLFMASLIALLVKNPPAMQFESWIRKSFWRRDRLPTPVFLGFPCGL